MEAYEKEVFNFFTTEANFLNMCKVAKHLPNITKQLKEDFWKLVRQKIDLKLKEDKTDFVVKITAGPLKDDRTKIMIYKLAWPEVNNQPVVAVAIQRMSGNTFPFYGPWINNDAKMHDIEKMYALFKNSIVAKDFESDGDKWFPFFMDVDIDFKNDEDHVKILPDRSEGFAESVASLLIDLAKKLEPELEEAVKMYKEVQV